MFMYEFDKINNELEAINNRMYLKKRYVVQHQQVVAAKKAAEANKPAHFVPMKKKKPPTAPAAAAKAQWQGNYFNQLFQLSGFILAKTYVFKEK